MQVRELPLVGGQETKCLLRPPPRHGLCEHPTALCIANFASGGPEPTLQCSSPGMDPNSNVYRPADDPDYAALHLQYGPPIGSGVVGSPTVLGDATLIEATEKIVLAGRSATHPMTRDQAGWLLDEWVRASNIIERRVSFVVRDFRDSMWSSNSPAREQLIIRVGDVITSKLTAERVDQGGAGFDFDFATDAIFVFWVDRLASVVAYRGARDVWKIDRRVIRDDVDGGQISLLASLPDATVSSNPERVLDSEIPEQAAEAFTDLLIECRRKRSESRQELIGLAVLAVAFKIPPLNRPTHWRDRAVMRQAIAADPTLRIRSLTNYVEALDRGQVPQQDALTPLWASLDADAADRLLHLRNQAALPYYVQAALEPRARPEKGRLAALRSAVIRLSSSREWRQLADEITQVWVAHEFRAFSDSTGRQSEATKRTLTTNQAEQRKLWKPVADRALAFEGQPLGATEDEVCENMLALSTRVKAVGSSYLDAGIDFESMSASMLATITSATASTTTSALTAAKVSTASGQVS